LTKFKIPILSLPNAQGQGWGTRFESSSQKKRGAEAPQVKRQRLMFHVIGIRAE